MKQPSAARKRTLALHDRALRFSHAITVSCPKHFSDIPSCVVWNQLIRAGDSASSNLIEADAASSDADFLNNMRIACREAKEAQTSLATIRIASLDHFQQVVDRDLESEAGQLATILATIILSLWLRLEEEAKSTVGIVSGFSPRGSANFSSSPEGTPRAAAVGHPASGRRGSDRRIEGWLLLDDRGNAFADAARARVLVHVSAIAVAGDGEDSSLSRGTGCAGRAGG
jgi:four helix bundle protein